MAEQVSIRIEGLPELLKTIERLHIPPEDVEPVLMDGAKKLQTSIRAAAPLGKTGNLRKAIVAKKGKGGGYFRSVFTASDFKRAPHSRLVEWGHRMVTHKGVDTGKMVKGKPYFWPTVEQQLPAIGNEILADLGKMVEDRMK